MLHSFFRGTKNTGRAGNSDKDKNTSESSNCRSSHRDGHYAAIQSRRRLVRSKNIQGLRHSDGDMSADASRSSLISIDQSSEVVSGSTWGSWSPSPSSSILQQAIDADTYLPLPPPLSLNNSTLQQSAQCSSSRSWDGDMKDYDGYLTDSASSGCSFESSSHGIFSVTRRSEGDLQNLPGMQLGSSVGVTAVQRLVPGYTNGLGEGGGLYIRTQVDRAQKSAPNSTFASPVSSPKAWGSKESQWLWNSASNSLQQGSSPTLLGLIDAHPLPLPPKWGTPPASPSTTTLISPRSSMVPPWGSSKPDAGAPIGKWQKGHLLGSGAFGKVYKGIHSETGEFCAIKEVEYVEDDPKSKESAKQLAQEIMLLSFLRHPNIVHYKGSEMVDGFLNIYLELVSGGSIYKLYQEFKKLEEPVIRRYTRQILHGLHFLHNKNTVHRDIKGANILVDQEGTVKLADFGMAKQIKERGEAFLSFKGSPYWMAPEVIMQINTGFEFAIDIWGLGCTVLEMVTGKPPWSEYEGVAAMFKVSRAEVPPIPKCLSLEGQSFIRLCLQRNPADRPSAAELLEHPFVQIPNNGPDLTMPASHLPDFLSSDIEERSSRQENGDSSIGMLRGESQPLNNSHYSHARMRTGICPSRSAPVSPRSFCKDTNDLVSMSLADLPPGFSTRPAGSPRGTGFDFDANLEKSSNVLGKKAGRQAHASNGVSTSVGVMVNRADSHWDAVSDNRRIPRNNEPRSNGYYRSEVVRPYREEEQDHWRKPYRTLQQVDETGTPVLLERLPHQSPKYNGKVL